MNILVQVNIKILWLNNGYVLLDICEIKKLTHIHIPGNKTMV